ncbi:hypothetical protein ACJRO7_008301, partial [Eucalyptus globulus]
RPNVLNRDRSKATQARSWANVAGLSAEGYELDFAPPISVGRKSVVRLSDNAKFAGDPKWNCCLVGYYVGKNVPFKITEMALKQAWGSHLAEVLANDDGFYFFIVPDAEFRKKILDRGHVTVARVPLVLKQWHHTMELKKDLQSLVPVWIRLKNIPFAYWSAPGISEIASAVGRPLYMDPLTEKMKRLSFARVCVEISAKLERCEEVEVWVDDKSFSVSVLYEWRPNSCAKCFAFGHNCLAKEELKQPLATDAVKPSTANADPLISSASEDGWKQVTNRKKNQNIGQKEKGEVAPPISALKAKVIEDPSSQNASEDLRTQKQGIETDSMALVVSNQNDAAAALSSRKNRRMMHVRGLGDPVKQAKVRNFVRSNNLCCVGIIETKISSVASISVASTLLPGWSWVNNYSHSHKGRIWVGWNPRDVDFLVNAVSVQAIHGRLLWLVSGKILFLSVVYAEHRFISRRPLWEDLIQTSGTLSSVPWIVVGDFNAIRDPSDRVGGTNAWIPAFDEFRDCLVQAGLDDLRFTGFRYTWSTSSGINRKQRKIDRVLVNGCWNSVFSFSKAAFLPPGISDHTPMVIKVMPTPRSSKPFKFFNFWMSHPEFSRMVTELRLLKCKLKQINKESFSDLSMRTAEARRALQATQDAMQANPLSSSLANTEKQQLQAFAELRLQEESFYRQKSRVRWLKDGDLNTRFFHQMVNKHHLQNKIISVTSGDTTTLDPSEVQKVFVDHFQNLLAASPTSGCLVKEEIQAVLNHLLVEEQVRFLSSPISDDEIRNTLFSLATGKAPGPDGFNVEFFKRSWDIVGASVIMAVKDFFVTGELLKQINTTIIALVPKIPNASTVHDFRLIACCNTIYKCITKLIANRLARVLPSIVSLPQNAFVKGRHISDYILLAQELFSGFHHDPYRAKCVIKVDFTKAYDTVSWEFIEVCLQAFGFPQIFVDRIMICIRSPKFSICLNEGLHGFFASGRGIRQGDPMSPYIFTLMMEVFTGLLDRRTSRP